MEYLLKCWIIDTMEIGIEMRGAVMGKLMQDLNRSQNAHAMSADKIRKLEIEKKALEMDNEVLERDEGELKK